jgi:hypothetical protein
MNLASTRLYSFLRFGEIFFENKKPRLVAWLLLESKLLVFGLGGFGFGQFFVELVNAAIGLDEALLAGVEGMAV